MDPNRPASALPPPPKRPVLQLYRLFDVQLTFARWPVALRAALCIGVLLTTSWALGDMPAGMMATLGAFTVLYGTDRPYRHRAVLLAGVALAFAGVVTLGVAVRPMPVVVVLGVLVGIAALTTYFCNALTVGPPGAYMFVLACAAATALPTEHLSPAMLPLLVFAGGLLSWCIQMAGALFAPRGPEIAAVRAASRAVVQFAQSIGTDRHDELRHSTAQALHDGWTKLVAFQPLNPPAETTLSRLRAANRELHQIFAKSIDADPGERDALVARARRLGADAIAGTGGDGGAGGGGDNAVPLGRPTTLEALRESLTLTSPEVLTAGRVAIATALAGAVSVGLGLDHAYWAIAAAALVLHQGLDWTRTLQRSVDRIAGTIVGLGLAGGVPWLAPQGLLLAAILVALQFAIELFVVRNYAIAVVFITAIALVIGTGGIATPDVGHLLWARGIDTVIGCVIGLAVHIMTASRWVAVPVRQEIVRTLAAINAALGFLAIGDVTSRAARHARRDLQHRAIVLLKAFDAGIGATAAQRGIAERQWPAVVATQRLAYRVLAACWMLEEAGRDQAPGRAETLFAGSDVATARQAVSALATAVEAGKPLILSAPLPAFLDVALKALANSIVSDS